MGLRIQAEAVATQAVSLLVEIVGCTSMYVCHSFIDGTIRKWRSRAAAADSLLVFQKGSRRQGRLTSRRLVDETTTDYYLGVSQSR